MSKETAPPSEDRAQVQNVCRKTQVDGMLLRASCSGQEREREDFQENNFLISSRTPESGAALVDANGHGNQRSGDSHVT